MLINVHQTLNGATGKLLSGAIKCSSCSKELAMAVNLFAMVKANPCYSLSLNPRFAWKDPLLLAINIS